MEKSFKKFIIIFFSYFFPLLEFCVFYNSCIIPFKTPKIEKKSHTLYGFLITDKNQECYP